MLIRKISIRLNDQNTLWYLHLDIIIQIIVADNFISFIYRNIARSGSSLKIASLKNRSSCLMTVMLLKIMKSLNISNAVCSCLGKSSLSIMFWNSISLKAPIKLKIESVIKLFLMNFTRKSWIDELFASLMGTRKRMHQCFFFSPPSRRSTCSTYITVVGLSCRTLIV